MRVAGNWSHGPYDQKSWVGYRFIITRNTPPYADGTFSVVYRSPIAKQRANRSEVAFFGPFTWTPPAARSRWPGECAATSTSTAID